MSEPLVEFPKFDRRSGIGASMSPGICGLSPWSNPLGCYLYYTGQLADAPETEAMLLGNDLEDGIRRAAVRQMGAVIVKPGTKRHPKYDFLYASPDGIIGDGSERHGFEAKHVGPRHAHEWGEAGTDEVPDYVNVQAHHQMEVFGFSRVTVGALIWGELRLYELDRSDIVIRLLLDQLGEFWNRVQMRNPPEPDWSDPKTPALIHAMHPPSTGKRIALDGTTGDEAILLAQDYEAWGDREKQARESRATCKAQLVAVMKDAAEAVLPDGTTIKRRTIARKEYAVPAGEYVDFRIWNPQIKKLKKEKVQQ